MPALIMLGLMAAGLATGCCSGGVGLLWRRRANSEKLLSDWEMMQGNAQRPPVESLPVAPSTEPEWWYLDETRQQVGPLAETAIRGLRESGVLMDATLLWSESVEEWTPFAQVLPMFRSPCDA